MNRTAGLVWKFALPPVLAVALLTLVMLGFERQLLGDSMIDRSMLRTRQRADVLSRQLEVELRDAVSAVRLLARSPLMRPDTPVTAVRAELDNLVAQSAKFAWVGLTALDGRVIAGSRGWLEGQSIAQRPVFQRGREGMLGDIHKAVVLAPLLATLPGGATDLIDIGEPVRDAEGRLVGVITAHLGLSWVRSQIEVAIGPPAEASQLGLSAFVFTGSDKRSVVPDALIPVGLPLNEELPGRWRSVEGRGYIVAHSHLNRGEGAKELLPWHAVVVQTEDAVLAPVSHLSRYMLAVGVAAALILAALSVWLSRHLLGPWSGLFDAALASSQRGDLRLSAEVSSQVRAILAGRSSASPTERMLGWLAHDIDNLRRAIDHLPFGLVLLNRQFRIEYSNPAFTQLLGWSTDTCRDQLAGLALLDPGQHPSLEAMYGQLSDPPGEFSMRMEARTAAGDHVPVHWHMVPLIDSEAHWVGALAVVQDISAERAALQRAESLVSRLRALADAAIDTLLATLDRDGRVLEWSRGAEQLTGLSSAHALGRALVELLGNADLFSASLRTARDLGIASIVLDVGARHFEGSLYALQADREDASYGLILRDTAEQRDLFRQLQLGEQRLRLAIQAAQLATWEIDLSCEPMRVVWTEGYARMLGLPADASGTELGLTDVVHPDDWDRFKDALHACARTDQPLQIEFRIRHRQGWRHHALYGQALLDGEGRALRMIGAGMDVTDQRLARQALSDSQARFGAIIANASDAIISVDLDGRIELFNPAAERVFGYKAEQMLGASLARLLPESARAHHQTMMEGFAHSGVTQRAMGPGLVRGQAADGRVLALEASISQAVTNGRVVLTAILRDVTERVAQARQLESARDELAHLNRRLLEQEMQSSRRMAHALHDELGQSLAALRLHWEGYTASSSLQREQQEKRIAEMIELANRQIRSVLADLRPPLLDEMGLAAALDNEMCKHELTAGEATVRLDASARAQQQRWPADVEYAAFMIAREAMLNAVRHAQATEIVAVLDGDERLLTLSVRDDGVGIDPGARDGRPGHLGLVGMRERAHGIGAQLQIDGGPGHGTIVTLSWSISDAPQQPV